MDLFFVLSGYLITAIVLDHGDSPRFLGVFYVRRGLRIWPIYYLVLGVLVAINGRIPRPEPLGSVPYYLTYTQNLPRMWRYDVPKEMVAFDHSWTLALEEQFYLIWPALILLAARLPDLSRLRRAFAPGVRGWRSLWARGESSSSGVLPPHPVLSPGAGERVQVVPIDPARKRTIFLALGAIALSVAAREGGWIAWEPFVERTLIGRCDGFALGGLLAAMMGRPRPRMVVDRRIRMATTAALVGGLLYIAWGMIAEGDPVGFLGLPTPRRPSTTILAVGVTYFGLVGTVAANAGSRWLAPLRMPPLVYLGLISYGVYLYHVPIFWAIDGFPKASEFRYDQPWTTRAAKVAITIAAASASWFLIERPILSLKDRFGYGPVAPPKPRVPPLD